MADGTDLLRQWLKRVRESSFAHYTAEEHYSRLHYYVGLPACVLAAIVGTTVFASLDKDVDFGIKFIVGLISVVTAIATGLQTFLRLAEQAERHRKVAGEYGDVRRHIEQMLVFNDQATYAVIDEIRRRIDAIVANAPNVPNKIWTIAEKKADADYFLGQDAPKAPASASPNKLKTPEIKEAK
jgi:hypothetical protein